MSVQLSLDSTNVQHERIVLKLVKPEIPNFSVLSISESTLTTQQPQKNSAPCESSIQPQTKKQKMELN